MLGGQGGKGEEEEEGRGRERGRRRRRRRRGGGSSRSLVLFENVELGSRLPRMLRALFIWQPGGREGEGRREGSGQDWAGEAAGLRAEPLRPTAARKDGYGCGYGCGCGCRGGAG